VLLFDCEVAQSSGDVTMAKKDSSFGQLLKASYCPICGVELSVEVRAAGKQVLICSLHGEMKCFVDEDPKAVLARFCGGIDLGIKDLEASL
jgi:hypothetical protein